MKIENNKNGVRKKRDENDEQRNKEREKISTGIKAV